MKAEPQNQWRLAYAQELFAKLGPMDQLAAAFVGGSVARGIADEFSDLELCFVWKDVPKDSDRKKIIDVFQGTPFVDWQPWSESTQSVEDNIYVDGFQIDIWHNTFAKDQADSFTKLPLYVSRLQPKLETRPMSTFYFLISLMLLSPQAYSSSVANDVQLVVNNASSAWSWLPKTTEDAWEPTAKTRFCFSLGKLEARIQRLDSESSYFDLDSKYIDRELWVKARSLIRDLDQLNRRLPSICGGSGPDGAILPGTVDFLEDVKWTLGRLLATAKDLLRHVESPKKL